MLLEDYEVAAIILKGMYPAPHRGFCDTVLLEDYELAAIILKGMYPPPPRGFCDTVLLEDYEVAAIILKGMYPPPHPEGFVIRCCLKTMKWPLLF